MTVEYEPAPAVEAIAAKLIAKHHRDLAGERIEYVFRSDVAKSAGREVWGKARKIGGLNAYLSSDTEGEDVEPYFVIEIARPVWDVLDCDQRAALVDHELCHCAVDDDGKQSLVAHDVEEFKAVIERHGLWRPDLEDFVKTGYQMRLDETV